MKRNVALLAAVLAVVLASGAAGPETPVVRGERGLQPLAFEMNGETKVFRLTAEKIRWETREGTLVEAMAYNRMIPGPVDLKNHKNH